MMREVCRVADLDPIQAEPFTVVSDDGSDVRVAVVRDSEGDWHAISDICSHGQVSLSDGEIEGCVIECILHGSQFDLRTGQPIQPPAVQPIPVYPITIDGDSVLVDVDTTLERP